MWIKAGFFAMNMMFSRKEIKFDFFFFFAFIVIFQRKRVKGKKIIECQIILGLDVAITDSFRQRMRSWDSRFLFQEFENSISESDVVLLAVVDVGGQADPVLAVEVHQAGHDLVLGDLLTVQLLWRQSEKNLDGFTYQCLEWSQLKRSTFLPKFWYILNMSSGNKL